MGLLKRNQTGDDTSAISSSAPFISTITTHSHNVGADGLLVVSVFYINTKSVTAVSWNGVAMTKEGGWTNNDTSAAVKFDVWYLVAPDTGNHDLVYTFNSAGGNCTSLINSFTGADQTTPLQSLSNVASNTPHSRTITISENSMIMAIGTSRWTFDGAQALRIDGTAYGFGSCDIDTSISSAQVCVKTRNANLTAGSKTVITDTTADSFKADNTRIEIIEAGVAPPTSRRRMWLV